MNRRTAESIQPSREERHKAAQEDIQAAWTNRAAELWEELAARGPIDEVRPEGSEMAATDIASAWGSSPTSQAGQRKGIGQ